MFILVIITLTARYLHPRKRVLSWHITGLDVWHVSDLPVVSRAGDKSPDDSNWDMSWRYEIFKWDANWGGLCDTGCLMLMFSLEYKKNLCHFIWIKKKKWEWGMWIWVLQAWLTRQWGKFYSVAAFVKLLFSEHSNRRHYGLNAGQIIMGENTCLLFKPNCVITFTHENSGTWIFSLQWSLS